MIHQRENPIQRGENLELHPTGQEARKTASRIQPIIRLKQWQEKLKWLQKLANPQHKRQPFRRTTKRKNFEPIVSFVQKRYWEAHRLAYGD